MTTSCLRLDLATDAQIERIDCRPTPESIAVPERAVVLDDDIPAFTTINEVGIVAQPTGEYVRRTVAAVRSEWP